MNTEELMLKREYFPIVLEEATRMDGVKFWAFGDIVIPPYHPSMKETGLYSDLVLSVVDEALEGVIGDLEEIADKRPDAKSDLESIKREPRIARVSYRDVKQGQSDRTVVEFPISGQLTIEHDKISPFGGDHYMSIDPEIAPEVFFIPQEIELSPALMQEYEMTDKGLIGISRQWRVIKCPYMWRTHNVSPDLRILYKNLVIAIDNEVVRRKYSTL